MVDGLFRISALEMLMLGADELQIRPNGWWLVYFIPNKRIGNAYTQDGRIANSPERGRTDGCWRETGRIPSLQCGWAANSPERPVAG